MHAFTGEHTVWPVTVCLASSLSVVPCTCFLCLPHVYVRAKAMFVLSGTLYRLQGLLEESEEESVQNKTTE